MPISSLCLRPQGESNVLAPFQPSVADRAENKPVETTQGDDPPRGLSDSNDAVELALAEAIRGATAAGQWAVVAQLAGELEARRRARESVVDLGEARKRREK